MGVLSTLFSNVQNLDFKQLIMWVIGGILIYLAIKRKMEPTLLLPIGFGAILVNLPMSGAIDQVVGDIVQEGPISILFKSGIANELFPLLLFVGIGAMIDFGPLLTRLVEVSEKPADHTIYVASDPELEKEPVYAELRHLPEFVRVIGVV